MSDRRSDVVVVGGGIVGLCVAYWCARAGLKVAVVDEGIDGRKASWASAGILGAQPYEKAKTPFIKLLGLGGKLHRELELWLREETGLDAGYRWCGGIELARDAEELHSLRSAAGHYTAHGVEWRRLERAELQSLEPHLNTDRVAGAYLVEAMGQVRPPRFLAALHVACQRRDVQFVRETVVGFVREGSRIDGVMTTSGPVWAENTVVAAGAWSEQLLARLGVSLPTPPVRGQVVLLRGDPRWLRHIIMVDRHYVVPRFDGYYLIGSTQENTGFDFSTTVEGVSSLLHFASWVCPALGAARIERCWAGLRPGNADGKPYIGAVPGHDRLWIAAGHFRSGYLAAPATGQLLCELLTGQSPCVPLWPFQPSRDLAGRMAEED